MEFVAYRMWIVTVFMQTVVMLLLAEAMQQLSSGKLYCHT